ncbi:ComEC/Rec2-related protein [Methylocella silvestris BL2]|uniref:ComEC/Rec2-related protein n=1 Tax=Methylocella silvestris (strain DSM 15510 / CIP 108128 / LMG 27833 / NCIMB 13906 / BL2) TaxID=395965 RepID=B8EK87_METSB|nr:ComEC/Rec2 family competence protein [Methylocella silvestris]ACK50627.1 ComEC/Rec2-related protein [Methylocella silvestris BL2]
MARPLDTALADGGAGRAGGVSPALLAPLARLRLAFAAAFETECAQRRMFLWLPVAAGAGVVSYLSADREPSMWLLAALTGVLSGLAFVARERRAAFLAICAAAAFFAGEFSAAWRSTRVAAPVIQRTTIGVVEGFVEQMDFRRSGARFVLRVRAIEGLAAEATPYRVRLSVRRAPPFEAGTYIKLKARLLPPSRASLPGGYDFARDAWFARLGGVGNALGRIETLAAPEPAGFSLGAAMALDRGRNALLRRIDAVIGGDAGAIAAAMVTGKRDLLSENAKEVIREAGIFHIITISGVQMTLVAAIFFIGFRRALSLSPSLALRYPIKKWSAALAMLGAVIYDVSTGSRVGTERALIMTLIMLGAVLADRQALTMRNLAFAALFVILAEPEAIMGASFQLSFAAVAALVAVYEGRMAAASAEREEAPILRSKPVAGEGARLFWTSVRARLSQGPGGLLFATFCATAATASFMAYNFHELSPYVLIGNPLTLTVIEVFAVPGALLGTLLYPIGLDPWVWRYLGFGVDGVMWAARQVGQLPGASIHLPAFAPFSLAFLTLAVLCMTLWRTLLFRAIALPLLAIGLFGAASGPKFDVAVAPGGEAAAYRGEDGRLAVLAARPNLFAAEQWLRADADGRPAAAAVRKSACDKAACVGRLADGRTLSLVVDRAAFAEDCLRADIIVTPLFAPKGCAAQIVLDRDALKKTGAVTLAMTPAGLTRAAARSLEEDRPWSPAPRRTWGRAPAAPAPQFRLADADPSVPAQEEGAASRQPDDGDDGSPIE